MRQTTRYPSYPRRMTGRGQRGFSLVELLVALTVGMFLIGAIAIIYITTSQTSRISTMEAQMDEDASIALDLLQQQIRLAGYSSVDSDGTRHVTGRAIFGCDGEALADSGSSNAFKDLKCDGVSASDRLAIRYEATELNSQTVDDSGTEKPANCAYEALSTWDASGDGGIDGIALAESRYYVSTDTDGIPSLYCQGRKGTGLGTATALIPGVENMQITYGVTVKPTAGNELPNQVTAYVSAGTKDVLEAADDWSRVIAVRICLLARSATIVPTPNEEEKKLLQVYKDCDGSTVDTATDGYMRRAYVTTIQLRNIRPALPAPYATDKGTVQNPWRDLSEGS